MNLITMLGKATGGERVIALMGQLYRLMGRCMTDTILGWRKDQAKFWDNAIRGSSALQAALKRVVIAETQVGKGLLTAAFF